MSGERIRLYGHQEAQAEAASIPAPAARSFVTTGKITPGFRAAEQLYDVSVGLQQYVADRVDHGATAAPTNWPRP